MAPMTAALSYVEISPWRSLNNDARALLVNERAHDEKRVDTKFGRIHRRPVLYNRRLLYLISSCNLYFSHLEPACRKSLLTGFAERTARDVTV